MAIPKDTVGFLNEPLAPNQRRPQSFATWRTLTSLLSGGPMMIQSLAASEGHGALTRNIGFQVVEGAMADAMLAGRKKKKDPFADIGSIGPGGGEANFRLPNRASFSSEKKKQLRVMPGIQCLHSPTKKIVTILGASHSKPGLVKVKTATGTTFRVDPVNLEIL
ncbi:MAG: hypothetical protein KGI50_07470 [Patescibacteria group bacterium]|nr:hypothetical protein [Patescibacteria group bacterium]MDE2439168.1 hypothetical protein [Patescibacteria group bacterium]